MFIKNNVSKTKNYLIMKSFFTKTLLTLSFTFSFFISQAQIFPYTFLTTTENYSELTGAIELTTPGLVWDDPRYAIPLGFEFSLFDDTNDSLFFIGVGAELSLKSPNSPFPYSQFEVYFDDLIDVDSVTDEKSTISYLTEGVIGSRIFKLEWKNVGFYEEVAYIGTASNRISFQLWLYETSNDIEFRFGPSNITDPNTIHPLGGPSCGLIDSFSMDLEFKAYWAASGNAAMPSIIQVSPNDLFYYYTFGTLDTHPADGQVYRFTNTTSSTKFQNNNFAVQTYPSLVQNEFFVEVGQNFLNENTQINIVNSFGQIIYNKTITSTKERLDASDFPKGIYYVIVVNEIGRSTQKIMKN